MRMGFFSFLSPKKKSERVLVVHIDSSSVSGAFVTIADGRATIHPGASADIQVVKDLASADFEREMRKALSAMLAMLRALAQGAPDRTVVYLASPWYAAQVRVARTSRPKDFVASQTILSDMVARELKAFEEEEMQTSHARGAPLRAIESKTMQVKLNGYDTPNPIGLACKELELSIFVSVAPEATLAGIEDVIEREYKVPLAFSTFLASSFIVTRDFFPHEKDYVLVDFGGEVTDVSVVRDGALATSFSFPIGRNALLRRLSHRLNRSIAESITICSLYNDGKVEASVRQACDGIIKESKDEWIASFHAAAWKGAGERSLPSTVMLSVGDDVASWFADAIQREEFHRGTLTGGAPKVLLLDASVFHESLAFARGAERNPFIMIDALAAAR